jgi:putative FmdB family regulatory protein
MPTYQFECRECGSEFELRRSFEDASEVSCLTCGSGNVRKVFRITGIILKGSGFYRTDSRASGSGNGQSSRAGAESTESTKGAGEPAASGPASDGGS